ncbi:hypothetical protein Bca52824_021933 [Brassica carinata]|uniref:Uncharacterized protein n=1 Tax=Brassica carinata TaxID=52824 RepID=A0A8X7VFQ0_BRACI|nr:hypothetical protein Bca52824_021933 [Brassica carinata]
MEKQRQENGNGERRLWTLLTMPKDSNRTGYEGKLQGVRAAAVVNKMLQNVKGVAVVVIQGVVVVVEIVAMVAVDVKGVVGAVCKEVP